MQLDDVVKTFADGFQKADSLSPVAVSFRSGKAYRPGLGPHGENATVALVLAQVRLANSYFASARPVPYPGGNLKCDLGLGEPLDWVIEVKMARAYGDNGKLDDTYLKDLLSPYEGDHSALTDASKLRRSGFSCRKAVLVYGFDYPGRPLEPAIHALEVLLREAGRIGDRNMARVSSLVHPVHREGSVVAWEILP